MRRCSRLPRHAAGAVSQLGRSVGRTDFPSRGVCLRGWLAALPAGYRQDQQRALPRCHPQITRAGPLSHRSPSISTALTKPTSRPAAGLPSPPPRLAGGCWQDYFTIKVCSVGKSDRRRDVTQENPLRPSEWGFKICYFPNIYSDFCTFSCFSLGTEDQIFQ